MLNEQTNQDRAIVVNPFKIVSKDEQDEAAAANSYHVADDHDHNVDDVLLGCFDGHAPRFVLSFGSFFSYT